MTTPCQENEPPKIRLGEPRDPKKLSANDWFIDALSGQKTEDGKRRRRAKQKCWADCPMRARLLCLDEGLEPENVDHGIWGGYTEEERRNIRDAIDEHQLHKRRLLPILARGEGGRPSIAVE